MRFTEAPRVELLYDATKVTFTVDNRDRRQVLDLVDKIDTKRDYDLEAKVHRNKRSLDANGYLWVLIQKLAVRLNMRPTEVYRRLIQESSNYTVVPIREDAIDQWSRVWTSNGSGWLTEDMGACRNVKGYHNIKCYYGSSTYDSKQMSQLLDIVIEECKAQGIEYMSENELARLKAEWQ